MNINNLKSTDLYHPTDCVTNCSEYSVTGFFYKFWHEHSIVLDQEELLKVAAVSVLVTETDAPTASDHLDVTVITKGGDHRPPLYD
ncbi:hypothetical protein F2P79_010965 [Pimephales promelas]|nr:hypothetical protein F2P79_010965 [Pimephales promelas]